jgi:hypothetical protein
MKTSLLMAVVGFALCDLALAKNAGLPENQSAAYKITTRRLEDVVQVQVDKDQTVFAVRGPLGISNADIERLGANWPQAVMLRLHMRGLESLRASNGHVTLHASLAAAEGKTTVHLWHGESEQTDLDEKSPYWMDVRALAGDGTLAKAMPANNGYFEFKLPKAFFAGNPKSITRRWIDFYR